jgi:hypothetical protein
MNHIKFKRLLTGLLKEKSKGDQWLDSVPGEVNSVFFDNPYVDSLQRSNTLLLQSLFEDTLLQEVEWFLYEWEADKPVEFRTITYPDGSAVVIDTVDDFVNYLINEALV